jgi:hypothetical protein
MWEPPWYGTVCPVVWEDGGSDPASYPIVPGALYGRERARGWPSHPAHPARHAAFIGLLPKVFQVLPAAIDTSCKFAGFPFGLRVL